MKKNVKKVEKLLQPVFDSITNMTIYPPFQPTCIPRMLLTYSALKFFFYTLQQTIRYKYPIPGNNILEKQLLYLFMDLLKAVTPKNAHEKDTIEVIIISLRWYLNPEQTEWSGSFLSVQEELESKMHSWRKLLTLMDIGREDAVISWKVSTEPFLPMVQSSSTTIRDFVCSESKHLLEISFGDNHIIKNDFKRILQEIHQLRINNFNEKSNVFSKMSVIKMHIKGL